MGNRVPAMKETSGTRSGMGGSWVQVVLLSGESASFKTPVTARTVMRKFPQHLVIHCSAVPAKSISSRDIGPQRYKVYKTVLKPQNHLKVEHNYLIVPTSTTTSRSIADSWVMFAFNKCAERKKSAGRQRAARKAKTVDSIRRVLAHVFKVSSPCLLLHEERKRSLSFRYDEPTKESKESSTSSHDSKDSQPIKSRSHSKERKLSTWNRFPNTCSQALSKATAGVPDVLGYMWQPSPELCKGFLIPITPVTIGNRVWKPVLACIPESPKGISFTYSSSSPSHCYSDAAY